MVDVGLVVGVIAPMTPNGAPFHQGQAVVAGVAARDEDFRPLRLARDEAVLTILSSARPRPVSAWASCASETAWVSIAARIEAMISMRFCRPNFDSSTNAARAAVHALVNGAKHAGR